MPANEKKIIKLEEEVSHLTLSNEELSSEVLSQWKRIEELEKKLSHLEGRFGALEDTMDNPIENTKPPHW